MKLEAIISILILLTASGTAFGFSSDSGKGAIVKLSGTIQPSSSGSLYSSGGVSPDRVRSLNDKIESNNYDAVVYEINSGGGTVVASKEIMRDIEEVEVPTVCRFRDIAASGAYMIALGCDHVVADPSSITGSIGVKSSYLEFSGALEKYGLEYVNITSGKNKDIGSPYKNITQQEKEILKDKAELVHEQFLTQVRQNRNISDENFEQVSTGTIFLGSEAEEIGLVDELGGREEAFSTAENITGKDLEFSTISQQQSFNIFSLLSADSLIRNILGVSQSPMRASLY